MRRERVLEIIEKETEIARIRELARIEDRLIEKMKGERPILNDNLIDDIAEWYTWFKKSGHTASACTADWHVYFLQWALMDRCEDFLKYSMGSSNPRSPEALKALLLVWDLKQPWKPSKKTVFHALWGWFQEEMEKPGYEKPRPVEEIICQFFDGSRENNEKIKEYFTDGCGGLIFMKSVSADQDCRVSLLHGLPTMAALNSLNNVAQRYLMKDPSYYLKDCYSSGAIIRRETEDLSDVIYDSYQIRVPGNASKERLLEIATSKLPKYIPPDSTEDISGYPVYAEEITVKQVSELPINYRIKAIQDSHGNKGFGVVFTEFHINAAVQELVGVYGTIERAMSKLNSIGTIADNNLNDQMCLGITSWFKE